MPNFGIPELAIILVIAIFVGWRQGLAVLVVVPATILLTFFWERTAAPLSETVDVQLLDENGQIAHIWQVAPVPDTFDDSAWESGQRLRALPRYSAACSLSPAALSARTS